MEAINRIGITLSGGGIRAMVFHAGVLKYLACNNLMENIGYISSVSGGSLFTGLIFHFNQMKWPNSREYIDKVLPKIQNTLTNNSLQTDAMQKLLNPLNWRYTFNRAVVVSKSIESLWGVKWKLKDLPEIPVWAINGTTGENGRRFRIKGRIFGDYEIGYTDIPEYKLCTAMAMSAAFPGGIGPIRFNTNGYSWRKKEEWDSTVDINGYAPVYKVIELYDGGLYDNLGLEPLFDVGQQKIKNQEVTNISQIFVSDASTPLPRAQLYSYLNPLRIKRWIDITLDQVRALRVRAFVNFIKSNPSKGRYMQLGSDAVTTIKKYGKEDPKKVKELLSKDWLNTNDVKRAAVYPTTLKKMKQNDFDLLLNHGYQTAYWNDNLWS